MSGLTFSVLGVPKNWSNTGMAFRFNRNAAMAMRREYNEWKWSIALLGAVARANAGWFVAESTDGKRIIRIHQKRRGILDEDGLMSSCKPIIDGLKRTIADRNANTGEYQSQDGAGLIFDDSYRYCIIEKPTQERIHRNQATMTTITIEIEDIYESS